MEKDPWTCNLCGSENVDQEFAVMLPMNSENGWEQAIENCFGNDFYWCNDCLTQVDPILKSENPIKAN